MSSLLQKQLLIFTLESEILLGKIKGGVRSKLMLFVDPNAIENELLDLEERFLSFTRDECSELLSTLSRNLPDLAHEINQQIEDSRSSIEKTIEESLALIYAYRKTLRSYIPRHSGKGEEEIPTKKISPAEIKQLKKVFGDSRFPFTTFAEL